MDDYSALVEWLRTTRLLSQRNQLALQGEAADAIQALMSKVEVAREGFAHIEEVATDPVSVTASLEAARVTAMVALQKMEE